MLVWGTLSVPEGEIYDGRREDFEYFVAKWGERQWIARASDERGRWSRGLE